MFANKPPIDLDSAKDGPKGSSSRQKLNWAIYTHAELVSFLDEISRELPPQTLEETNLERELMLQLHAVRSLQSDVIADEEVPANQRAQVAKVVTDALNKLVDLQGQVYTQERYKAVENLIIKHLKRLPEETAKAFLEDYRVALEGLK